MLVGRFDERSLAAAAGVDLGLDHGQRAAELVEGRGRRVGRIGHHARRHGDRRLAEDLFGLVFVDFHGLVSGSAGRIRDLAGHGTGGRPAFQAPDARHLPGGPCYEQTGGPDSLSTGGRQAWEPFTSRLSGMGAVGVRASCGFAALIGKLSGLPVFQPPSTRARQVAGRTWHPIQ